MRTAEALAFANASRELLQKGDAVGAERVLAPVIDTLRTDAATLHLMGLIKKAQNQFEEAERYLRGAVAHALSDGAYYNDLGIVLQVRGIYVEAIRVFRAALALMPGAEMVRVNLVRCLIAASELQEAEKEARAYIGLSPSAEAWTLLSQVHRAQERHEQALNAAAAALERAPNLRGLRQSYAAALERAGKPKEALACYRDLAEEKLDSPELAVSFARTLYADSARKDSEAVLEGAIRLWPTAPVHAALARVRMLRGEGEAATAFLEKEIANKPDDLALRLACADVLHRGDHHPKALRVLEQALEVCPHTPALLTAYAIILDEIERTDDALRVLRHIVEGTGQDRTARRNLLLALLRARRPDEALTLARDLLKEDPDEQYLIAIEATALRMLGEARYGELYDYDRLVRGYEIKPPRGFFTIENFNASLADVLRHQHRVNAHPWEQNLQNGAQTKRSLLMLEEPNIKAFLGAVDEAVRDYISRLSADANDPVARRRTERYRFSGLWSTRLHNGGYLKNHVHDRGWISATYYVSLMPQESAPAHAGNLTFGEPHRPIAGCAPERLLPPREGLLVLHPSYFWHGVLPFAGSERLSLSFDVIPG